MIAFQMHAVTFTASSQYLKPIDQEEAMHAVTDYGNNILGLADLGQQAGTASGNSVLSCNLRASCGIAADVQRVRDAVSPRPQFKHPSIVSVQFIERRLE